MALPSADTGGHLLFPHPDPELARKGWLRCLNCRREVHGTVRAGGEWDRCPEGAWTCPHCQSRNMSGNWKCFMCARMR